MQNKTGLTPPLFFIEVPVPHQKSERSLWGRGINPPSVWGRGINPPSTTVLLDIGTVPNYIYILCCIFVLSNCKNDMFISLNEYQNLTFCFIIFGVMALA